MSEEKDGLKSIKVYRFNNTKEIWHEFSLKFGVIADDRGYSDIIEGIVTPPDEKENLEILEKDDAETKKSKKEKQLARAANKKGFRDLVMSTDGISLNIVQNAVSDKLTRGDLEKAWERLERRWNPKTRENKVQFYTKCLHNKLENVRQRPMDWLAFMEKKRNKLANTGHIMDDEKFISHLLNSLPQAEYEGVILVIKERLRGSTCDLAQVEQLLEDKYLSMKTFRDIIMELRKLRSGETPTKPSEETSETAMMCWESLDESEQASKKRKTHTQDDATSGNANEMDDKTPTMPTHTTTMSKQLKKPMGNKGWEQTTTR